MLLLTLVQTFYIGSGYLLGTKEVCFIFRFFILPIFISIEKHFVVVAFIAFYKLHIILAYSLILTQFIDSMEKCFRTKGIHCTELKNQFKTTKEYSLANANRIIFSFVTNTVADLCR